MRADEVNTPVRLGDAPPCLPFRKPFDLNAWQLPTAVATFALVAGLDTLLPLSEQPLVADTYLSPMVIGRLLVLISGVLTVFVQPGGRLLPMWGFVALKHFHGSLVGWVEHDDVRVSYFPADAEQMTRMRLVGDSAVFVVEPPLWSLFKHTPLRNAQWLRHLPYRMLLTVEPQGSLELMTDAERAASWHALAAGLKALTLPVQFVTQTRPESAAWLRQHAAPPIGAPLESMHASIGHWAAERARTLLMRRLVVACSAADVAVLVEHVHDVTGMLADAGLSVRECNIAEQQQVFDDVYGRRRFYGRDARSFGIDAVDWVTLAVREWPRHSVVGWPQYIVRGLPVDLGLYVEPDDASWLTRNMEWFEGMAMIPTADTKHHDAYADLARVEGKLKRNEDSVVRETMLLSMPRQHIARVGNRLRKAGALFEELTFEHKAGRFATLPRGGRPAVGFTRPLDAESVAAAYPFGSGGLRMRDGCLLGVARHSPEAVTLDLLDPALLASMVVIVGTTGAGKTFLMQLLIGRSGLPFTIIDMKPHLDEIRHGDFYRFVKECGGDYHVCVNGEPLPEPHPTAQCYNLAGLDKEHRAMVLRAIAEQEWSRAISSLEDRIFAIDEGYELGKTEAGQDFIEKIVTQGRSVGFIGIAATQEVGDFLSNERLAKVVTMSSVQFALAQEFSNVDKVADKLKLGGEAREELRRFQPQPGDVEAENARYAIMRVGQRMCSMRIEASPEEIALYTTRPADKRAMRTAA